ncbi:urease accessory protein UreE [Lichenicoccus sp.]|uniref:urease accessory protein UreE n=1 Tax=Lichenicoccus sp. TaxID=2781899 RepID=UPI003D0A75E9
MRGTEILAAGRWDPSQETDQLDADYDQRHRRRTLLRTASGRELLLDLPHTRHLRDGDAIACDDGGLVRIAAVAERLLEITAPTPAALLRLAWHLGNRHLPTALAADRLLIREDHVIADMVRGLGGEARPVMAPFDPETGAYEPHGH